MKNLLCYYICLLHDYKSYQQSLTDVVAWISFNIHCISTGCFSKTKISIHREWRFLYNITDFIHF